MAIPYGTGQIFELPCKECAWWEAQAKIPQFGERAGLCGHPCAENGMPPLLSAHETCPGFEPLAGYPDYSKDCADEAIWWGTSEVLDQAVAINLIREGRIERPGKHASANLPFQTVTAEGIAFLSQYKYDNIGLGVSHLTRPVSEALSKWGVSAIRFLNPVALDPDGLEPFRYSDVELSFWGGVTGLDAEVASVFATCKGDLRFAGVRIGSHVAEVFSCCKANDAVEKVYSCGHRAVNHME